MGMPDICQVSDVRRPGGELPHSLPLPLLMLVRVDVEVDGAVEGGEEVAEAGHVRQPRWPHQLGHILPHLGQLPDIGDPLDCMATNEH